MHFLHSSSILTFFLLTTLVYSHPATQLQPRQADSLPDPPIAGFGVTVTSPNGTDITSNFQTLLYESTEDVAQSNLTERQTPSMIRPIDSCRSKHADFLWSECTYYPRARGSIQRYKVRCNVRPGLFIFETGFCNSDEICVNGPKNSAGVPTVANCIGQGRFREVPNYNSQEGREFLEKFLRGKQLSATVSESDRQTALRVGSLEIDAGVAGEGKVGGQVGLTSQEKCVNCVEIATGTLEEGTDFLNTQVMVGGAAAAAAGVLWLAVLSG